MQRVRHATRQGGAWLGWLALALGLVWSSDAGWRTTPAARAEVRNETPTQMFKSGAQQSVVVLREISETLKRIEGRVERLEALAESASKTAGKQE